MGRRKLKVSKEMFFSHGIQCSLATEYTENTEEFKKTKKNPF